MLMFCIGFLTGAYVTGVLGVMAVVVLMCPEWRP